MRLRTALLAATALALAHAGATVIINDLPANEPVAAATADVGAAAEAFINAA